MVATDASMSPIATNHSARIVYGWRVLEQFYAGPKTQFFASDGYRRLRLGDHITSMKTGEHRMVRSGRLGARFRWALQPVCGPGVVMRQ